MKKIFFLLIFLTFTFAGFSQTNLVPNPSFEDYNLCPDDEGQIDRVNYWYSVRGSCDYSNSCDTSLKASVPSNIWGFQYASTGQAYAGIHSFSLTGNQTSSIREYIQAQLTNTLIIGIKYFISFKVSPTLVGKFPFESVQYTNDKMGVLFRTVPNLVGPNALNIPNFAHLYAGSVISDTTSWTVISESFTADSAYQYITIGNFFDDLQTSYYLSNPNGMFSLSYYYIDDVCVSTDSLYCATWTSINEHTDLNQINIFPNPFYNSVNINLANTIQGIKAEIFNIEGKLVYEQYLNSNQNLITLENLNAGTYLLIININQKKFRTLLVKSKP